MDGSESNCKMDGGPNPAVASPAGFHCDAGCLDAAADDKRSNREVVDPSGFGTVPPEMDASVLLFALDAADSKSNRDEAALASVVVRS